MKYYFMIMCAGLGLAIAGWRRWEFSDLRWCPLYEQRIPSPNSITRFVFHSDSGAFDIDVQIPMTAAEASRLSVPPDVPPVPCQLGFQVLAGDRIVSVVKAESLRYFGGVGSTSMNCYSAGTINIPKYGKYTLEVTNGSRTLDFQSVNFSLERNESAVNASFAAGISKIVSYFLLSLSAAIGVISLVSEIWRKRAGVNSFC
jgi:hypothetical protein